MRRAKNIGDYKDMIFIDPRREKFWARVDQQLSLWKDYKSLDICCGYGRFTLDTGADFSAEMLKIAKERYPERAFIEADIKGSRAFVDRRDVIYEVNSLHSLGWTPEQFYAHFKGMAEIIACLEADRFTIFHDYR